MFSCFFSFSFVQADSLERLKGRILLQVEELGQAWYVEPKSKRKVSLGSPDEAFEVMRNFGEGITNEDLNKIQIGAKNLFGVDSDNDGLSDMIEDAIGTNKFSHDTDDDGYSDKGEVLYGYNPMGVGKINLDNEFAIKNSGKIFLQVERNGEAWYVSPIDSKRYFLGRSTDAFNLMRELGLGINNSDLSKIGNYHEETDEIIIYDKNGYINHNVPFTAQAPFANWDDLRQQDGCEESSVIMAMHWVLNKELSKESAEKEIIAMSDFQLEKYGSYKDTSARDTIDRLFKNYYDYHNVELLEDIGVDDIKEALYQGNIVIVPVNGRKLKNPYFTLPGPLIHMLVIYGYDPDTLEFITNEPGTRHGAGYRYSEDIIYDAIRDYYTGNHLKVQVEKKVMIIVSK